MKQHNILTSSKSVDPSVTLKMLPDPVFPVQLVPMAWTAKYHGLLS
jgi:hypothetical protein